MSSYRLTPYTTEAKRQIKSRILPIIEAKTNKNNIYISFETLFNLLIATTRIDVEKNKVKELIQELFDETGSLVIQTNPNKPDFLNYAFDWNFNKSFYEVSNSSFESGTRWLNNF